MFALPPSLTLGSINWMPLRSQRSSGGSPVSRLQDIGATRKLWATALSSYELTTVPAIACTARPIRRIVVLLLIGGNKSTQTRDIARAKEIAKTWQA